MELIIAGTGDRTTESNKRSDALGGEERQHHGQRRAHCAARAGRGDLVS